MKYEIMSTVRLEECEEKYNIYVKPSKAENFFFKNIKQGL